MNEIFLEVPFNPVTKKNSQNIYINRSTGRRYISPSEKYKQYARDCASVLPRIETITTPINIKCLFYMQTRRRVDLTNLLEAIDDILVNCGIIEDDNYNIVVSHDGSRVYYDKENPRTEIYITDAIN